MHTSDKKLASVFVCVSCAAGNNGTQFEFGHWVDLSDFSDSEELNEYIINHFQECDEKPFSPREEIMI
jgi:hypothetical protein